MTFTLDFSQEEAQTEHGSQAQTHATLTCTPIYTPSIKDLESPSITKSSVCRREYLNTPEKTKSFSNLVSSAKSILCECTVCKSQKPLTDNILQKIGPEFSLKRVRLTELFLPAEVPKGVKGDVERVVEWLDGHYRQSGFVGVAAAVDRLRAVIDSDSRKIRTWKG